MWDTSPDDITDGRISRALVLLAAPLVVQNFVQVVQQVVDTFWVGRIGEDAVAAVGLNYPVTAMLTSVAIMAPLVGTQVIVSQRVGAEEYTGARRIAVHGIAVGVALALVVTAAAVAGAETIVDLLGAGDDVAPLAVTYLATYAFALVPMAASDVLEGGFVGWGDSRAALYVNVVAVVVNVGLDPILIFGLGPIDGYGIRGAALATVAGYTAGFVLALAMALGLRDSFTLTREAVAFRVDEFRELLDVGAPSSARRLAQDGVRVVIVGIVATVGGAAGLAAYTVGARVASVAFIPATGLSQAAQSVVGQNLGAEQPDRARRTTWVGVGIAAAALTAVGAIQWLFPASLTQVFVPDVSEAALGLTVDYLRILAYGYWAIGATYVLRAGFNGARRTRTSMVASLLQYWALRLPIAVAGVVLLDMGVHAVFWAVTLSNVAAAVGLGAYYRYSVESGMFDRAAAQAVADD
ncbi:MATE family efflux transporter [Halostella sp. JP-L12]|uniref:MATE family efflux transporter n=1 Tax=Halostella TaxID=1843185 RepID=UPI000EF7C969|nr:MULTISPECIES: MATE family efflux transporter [Halostella]NHN45992.1 MATE family efflux transporter [Halostella sp. JP-L12]